MPAVASVVFRSARPRFASLVVHVGSERLMTMAFDESRGTGSGYDTFYVDRDLDGVIEESERLRTRHDELTNSPEASVDIPPLYDMPNAKSRTELNLSCYRPSEDHGIIFNIWTYANAGRSRWVYQFFASVNLSTAQSRPTILRADGYPRLEVQTQSDPEDRSRIDIALSMAVSGLHLDTIRNDAPIPASVTVRDAHGRVLRRETRRISDFAFG